MMGTTVNANSDTIKGIYKRIRQTASTAASNSSEMKTLHTQVDDLDEGLSKLEAGAL